MPASVAPPNTTSVLFYILTDADSQRDHVLGFFSKVYLSAKLESRMLIPHPGENIL